MDKNVNNTWSINVNALCNPDKQPVDGHETKINAELVNNEYFLKQEFNDEVYQMEMLLLYEKDIRFINIKEHRQFAFHFFTVLIWIVK